MVCPKCNATIEDNSKFCTYCGSSILDNSNVTETNNISQVVEGKKKKGPLFYIIIGIVALVIIAIVIIAVVFATGKKLKCTSSQGDITLIYNDKTITGYKGKNIGYDLEEQQEYAKLIGVEKYLDEFTEWFEDNTDGTCKR